MNKLLTVERQVFILDSKLYPELKKKNHKKTQHNPPHISAQFSKQIKKNETM